jgi:hypothetical protein
MPNQLNYKQDISDLGTSLGPMTTKINRIFVPEEYVIKSTNTNIIGRASAAPREFLELHFYIPDTDDLVYSAVVPLNDAQSNEIFSISGSSATNKTDIFQLAFWTPGSPANNYFNPDSLQVKYLNDLPSGIYDLIINIFSDEIGTYDIEKDEAKWRIKKISDSKQEIVLHSSFPTSDEFSSYDDWTEEAKREFEQFIRLSVYGDKFINFIRDLVINNTKVTGYLTTTQKTKYDSINQNYSTGTQTYLDEKIDHIVEHICSSLLEWAKQEFKGNRYRIQQDRFIPKLVEIVTEAVGEHEFSINTNDSGPVPFIVNQ